MSRGRFITVEGGEGAGKSTQVGLLVATLERAGIGVRRTREPGGSAGGESIRRLLLQGDTGRWDPVAEALLLAAARRDHVVRLIGPALQQGMWVVCDRFADSTLAYQGYGKGLAIAELEALGRFAVGDIAPDLTLILDLPVAAGLARAASRAARPDRFERLDTTFHEALRHGYRQIAAAHPKRCVLIDAVSDPATVHRAVIATVADRLGAQLVPIDPAAANGS
ncbi:MAG: dTMP kinase [Alphaproteobacteria bacterium]|nr:dTMP kinase [Alphaproteobacteria bacterium]